MRGIKKIYICFIIRKGIQSLLPLIMQTTRQRILDYLEKNRTASAPELSRAFRMTSANLRHHLQVLQEEGMIDVAGQDKSVGRGRPTLLYMTTGKAQEHSLGELASALFEQILGVRNSNQRTHRLKKIAKQLQGETSRRDETITQRLVAAAGRLNTLRYRAHWEAHTDGPKMILGQCPYAAIIDRHPELCQMDAHLLEGLLEEPVTQTRKLTRRPDGPAVCVFVVGKEKFTAQSKS